MNLMARVQGICLKPKEEWVKIQGESTPVKTLFLQYVIPLAAIPAVAQLLGYLFNFRFHFMGMTLLSAFLMYIFTVAATYVCGLVINALAPTFGSKPNLENAMKLIVYSSTPLWIGGILRIIPGFLPLVGLVGLYGFYILYLGFLTPMMETPQDKVIPYLVVSIIIMIGLFIVIEIAVQSITIPSAEILSKVVYGVN